MLTERAKSRLKSNVIRFKEDVETEPFNNKVKVMLFIIFCLHSFFCFNVLVGVGLGK